MSGIHDKGEDKIDRPADQGNAEQGYDFNSKKMEV